MKMRSAPNCRDRYELLLAALHDSRAQLPASAPRGAGPPAVPAHTVPDAASLAGPAAELLPPATLSSSQASAGAGAGLPGLATTSQAAPAQQQAAASAAGAHPGTGLRSSVPLQAVAAAALRHPPAGQHSAHGLTPQQSAAPVPSSSAQHAQQQQAALPPHTGITTEDGSAGPRQSSTQASVSLASAHEHDMQPRNGAVWSLSSELQTLREHLAWLASSNVVCGTEVSSACSLPCRKHFGSTF